MVERINELPLAAAFATLFVIVMIRANATYWIARGVRAGAGKSRFRLRLDRDAMPRAERLVARWGAGAVALSFATIGLQTAINATAGAMRMPLRRYLPAVVVGSLIWATIYSALGTAIVVALRSVTGS
ncbi:DedA family protein [Piscicoccus intestinalis]|uniref:DedA family protein n=1 Tax=Piscicoccus intestinalis TaxID=746033 RepID=UPI001FE1C1ED|nr:VTT domain-containing protein [Piscicoccus intestinalis]